MKHKTPREHIKRLERRIAHLDLRITNTSGQHDLTFDRAERAALRFAVEHLNECLSTRRADTEVAS